MLVNMHLEARLAIISFEKAMFLMRVSNYDFFVAPFWMTTLDSP